jgi:hypothetical protein
VCFEGLSEQEILSLPQQEVETSDLVRGAASLSRRIGDHSWLF